MTINKGLSSLVDNTPNFSNQALENAIDTLKLGWVLKGSQLDSVIASNTILTTSQKNDLKNTSDSLDYTMSAILTSMSNAHLCAPTTAGDGRRGRMRAGHELVPQ